MKRSASARRGERGLGASCPCAPGGHRHLHPLRAGAVPASGLHPSRGEHPLRAACCLPLLAPAAGSSAAAPRPAPGTAHRAPRTGRAPRLLAGDRGSPCPHPALPSRPGTARHGTVPRSAAGVRCCAVPCGAVPAAGARGLPGKLRARGWRGKERTSAELLPTFPPRSSFYHGISGPSHRHGPSFLLPPLPEPGSRPPPASGSPAPSLRRPRPSVPAAERVPARPRGGAGAAVHAAHPVPGRPQEPGILAASPGGGGDRPAGGFLRLLPRIASGAGVSARVCGVPGEISAKNALLREGEGGGATRVLRAGSSPETPPRSRGPEGVAEAGMSPWRPLLFCLGFY